MKDNNDIKTTSTISTGFRNSNKDDDLSGQSGAKNTPEIGNPIPSNATKIFPDEVPRRDGPGGE